MKSLRCDCDERRKSLGLIRQDMSRKISDLIETFKIIIGNYQWYNCGERGGTALPFRFWWGNAVTLAYTIAIVNHAFCNL